MDGGVLIPNTPICPPPTGVCGSGTPTWKMVMNASMRTWTEAAVWTGCEILYWGGRGLDSRALGAEHGRRYHPHTDTWRLMSTVGAPTARREGGIYQWTGAELFVWGGRGESDSLLEDGGLYDPATDSWRPIPRETDPSRAPRSRVEAVADWTGTEVVIFGGLGGPGNVLREGAFYNPTTGQWRLFLEPGPEMYDAYGGWARNRLFVWGSPSLTGNAVNLAYVYDDSSGWIPLPEAPLSPRSRARVVVHEAGMLVYGGSGGVGSSNLNNGAFFDFDTWTWWPILDGPSDLEGGSGGYFMFWTGCDYVLIDGREVREGFMKIYHDYRFNLESNTWTAMPEFRGTQVRSLLRWTWAGDQIVSWGGWDSARLIFE